MKALALFILLAFASVVSLQADILANGDFSDGHAHWKGDAQDPDTGGDLTANPSSNAGVIIKLKKDKWTKIYQSFSTHEKKLRYTITFTLGADYSPEAHPVVSDMGPSAGLDDIDGVYPYYGYSYRGNWMCIAAQGGFGRASFSLRPDPTKTGSQSLTGLISGPPDEHDDMIIVFAFPPGEGTINLTKIELVGASDE
jgi:hypothetical protein